MFVKSLAAALLVLGLAAPLAGCNPTARADIKPVQGDAFLGPADAKVTITEYGSPTCPACKSWHDTYWAEVKHDYVDTGKVRFVFREFAIHGPIDAAIFAIARCAGPEDFFSVLDEAFANQTKIVQASMKGGAEGKTELDALGAKFRLSPEQVKTCMDDREIIRRINDVRADAATKQIDSTPTFMVNGVVLAQNDWPSIKTAVDAALGMDAAPAPAVQTPAPAETPAPTETPAAPPAAPEAPH